MTVPASVVAGDVDARLPIVRLRAVVAVRLVVRLRALVVRYLPFVQSAFVYHMRESADITTHPFANSGCTL